MSESPQAVVPPGRRAAGLGQWPGSVALALLSVGMLVGGFLLNRLDQAALRPLPSPQSEVLPSLTPFLPTLTPTSSPLPVASPTPLPSLPAAETVTTSTPIPIPSPCRIPPGWEMYTVQAGDTLYGLALRTSVAYVTLAEANCLSTLTLYAGQRIALPPRLTPTPRVEPCGPPPDWVTYIVREGDTLFSLARRFGVSQEAIRRANCLSGYTILVGQALFVPPLRPTALRTATSEPSPTWTPAPSPTPFHTIPPTDTPTPPASPPPAPTTTPTATTFPTIPPTVTPTDTATPAPTDTPTPTDSPTPEPTLTPTITPFPTPTYTPPASETPAGV